MFDQEFIVGKLSSEKPLDYIFAELVYKNNLDEFYRINLRYLDMIAFQERHGLHKDNQVIERYIMNYGLMFFHHIDSNLLDSQKSQYQFYCIFQTVYELMMKTESNHIDSLLKCIKLMIRQSKIPPFELGYILVEHPAYVEDFEKIDKDSLLNSLLCPFQNDLSLDQIETIIHENTKYLTYLFKKAPERINRLFRNIIEYNKDKKKVLDQIYIEDDKHSYRFLFTCAYYCQNIYSNLAIENTIPKRSDTNSLSIMYWIIFDFFEITSYSLILLNINCQNQILLNPLLSEIYKPYLKKNDIFLKNEILSLPLYHYLVQLMQDREILLELTEDEIYEILFYWNYVIENKLHPVSSVICKELIRSLDYIIHMEKVTNPFILIKSIKIIYLLSKFYNVPFMTVVQNDFSKRVVDLSLKIDGLQGIDPMREKFFYKSYFLEMIADYYIFNSKQYVISLLKDIESVIEYLLTYLSNIILNSQTILVETLKTYEAMAREYLKRIQFRIDIIYDQTKSSSGSCLNPMDIDIKYHIVKYIYGIVKNCYDKGSQVIKIQMPNLMTGENANHLWDCFIEYVINPFIKGFNELLRIPGIVEFIERYYSDIPHYLKIMDKDLNTEFSEIYRVLRLDLKTIQFPDELPDEFLDPLLFTPIIDPIMLPESHVIMDKAVILAHLADHTYDPFNRQPLTLEGLNEYNDRDDVKMKCLDFISKRDQWITHYHSHND